MSEVLLIGIIILLLPVNVETITESTAMTNILLFLTQMMVLIMIRVVNYIWKRQMAYELNMINWAGNIMFSSCYFMALVALTVDMFKRNAKLAT